MLIVLQICEGDKVCIWEYVVSACLCYNVRWKVLRFKKLTAAAGVETHFGLI